MNQVQAEIGDGVTVQGPETLIREALEVPRDVFDVPAFLQSLAAGARENVTLDYVDLLFGDDHPLLPRGEPHTKLDIDPVRRWRTNPDGTVTEFMFDTRAPRFVPGERVWDVGTDLGPWVLIKPATLEIPVELPPFDDEPVHRKVRVNAWVVETSPWSFSLAPEACLTDEAPIKLSDEMLEFLESEAAEEALEDLAPPGWKPPVLVFASLLLMLVGIGFLVSFLMM